MKKIIVASFFTISAMPLHAESNITGEFLFGIADQESSASEGISSSGDDTSIGVRGAYIFNANFAAEFSYHRYGVASESFVDSWGDNIHDEMETTSLNFGIKGMIPLNDDVSINGRFGMSMWDYDLSETDSSFPGQEFRFSDDGTDFYYGIGAQYNINNRMFIGVEYTITEMDVMLLNVVSVDHEVKNFSLSFGVKI